MLLNELLKAIQPVQVTGDSRIEITGVNIDSRLVEAGQLFMAMRGTQTDGHAYIPAAIQKGATAILCEDIPEEPVAGITYIQVKDSEDAVGKIATTFYGNPTSQFELVGVTGTNGKTTIATLLYNTFRYFGYSSTSSNILTRENCIIGIPDIAFKAPTLSRSTACWGKWRTKDASTSLWKSVHIPSLKNVSAD